MPVGSRISAAEGYFSGRCFIKFNKQHGNSGGQMADEKQKKILGIIMAAVLLVSMYFVAGEGAAYVNSSRVAEEKGEEGKREKICVVIDAGHGSSNLRKVTKGK